MCNNLKAPFVKDKGDFITLGFISLEISQSTDIDATLFWNWWGKYKPHELILKSIRSDVIS